VGGVPCNEINSLEVEFLFMCNFTLFVTTDTYSQYYTELCNHAVRHAETARLQKSKSVTFCVLTPLACPVCASLRVR